ncbi:hypothetical protein L5515_019121 [Caenorhabditis briggsae]|uniref:Uncharacterized protein n=2 Tax=Caenorhabditis briggsae TaxID=6238 RepID=A0AAE9FDG7_CAEBR|nr:hypothetical protein L5515_019121 [Caenorhabditis briggsae]
MQSVVVLALLVASTQAFLFGPGGLFGAPAGGCDPCAAARAYPQQQPAYQPQYQQPAYQPQYQQPAYQPQYQQPAYQPQPAYQTAPAQHYQQPAPVQNYQTVSEPVAQTSGGAYAQAPPPPPPSSYATGAASAGYKRFH